MATKTIAKIEDALSDLMAGFHKLLLEIKADNDVDTDADELGDDPKKATAVLKELNTAIRETLESVINSEDYSTAEAALLVSALNEGLEEIDPDVFDSGEDEDSDEDSEDLDDDDDLEFDDDDDFDDDEDEDEEEDE